MEIEQCKLNVVCGEKDQTCPEELLLEADDSIRIYGCYNNIEIQSIIFDSDNDICPWLQVNLNYKQKEELYQIVSTKRNCNIYWMSAKKTIVVFVDEI